MAVKFESGSLSRVGEFTSDGNTTTSDEERFTEELEGHPYTIVHRKKGKLQITVVGFGPDLCGVVFPHSGNDLRSYVLRQQLAEIPEDGSVVLFSQEGLKGDLRMLINSPHPAVRITNDDVVAS